MHIALRRGANEPCARWTYNDRPSRASRGPKADLTLCYVFTRGSPTAIKYLVLRLDQAHSENSSPASQLHMYISAWEEAPS
jgi:hypothetical protein